MNYEAKALCNPSLVMIFIEELLEERRKKINKIRSLAQAHTKSGRAFDIVVQIAAIDKILAYAAAMDEVIGDEAERVFDIVVSAQKIPDEQEVTDDRIVTVMAIQACLSHAHLVTETLSDRCLEYIYKSYINSITDE